MKLKGENTQESNALSVDVTHTKQRRGNARGDGHVAERKLSQDKGTLGEQ